MAAGISPRTNRLVNIVVCVGAAIVIVGALFKIQHWKGADLLLPIGLLTEAVIFLVYALLPPADAGTPAMAAAMPAGNPALASMDKMLQEADITPVSLKRLGENFSKLGTTIEGVKDVSGVVAATNDYSKKTAEAATALGSMTKAYTEAANTMGTFNQASEGTKKFHDQVQVLTKNLTSLNTIYELELQESNNHLKALNSYYGTLAQASGAMANSVEDAKKAQDQISALATNLGKLNNVYGNMLNAMQGR
jgi:gliding motility-associated protein GldL